MKITNEDGSIAYVAERDIVPYSAIVEDAFSDIDALFANEADQKPEESKTLISEDDNTYWVKNHDKAKDFIRALMSESEREAYVEMLSKANEEEDKDDRSYYNQDHIEETVPNIITSLRKGIKERAL